MIPQFPEFKNLELSDKEEIESHVHKYLPYSDYNFMSMWSWNTGDHMKVCWLNNNIVVCFSDYIDGSVFYSFIGTTKVDETIESLLKLSHDKGMNPVLKLIPEVVIHHVGNDFSIVPDEDNHDYVYSIEKLSTYNGNSLRSKRNLVNRFLKNHTAEVRELDLSSESIRAELKAVFQTWIENKGVGVEFQKELEALGRIMRSGNKNLVTVGVYIEGKLAGFVINEAREHDHHAILHFEKADEKYLGIYAFLMQENAKILHQKGKKFLNNEQDLGLPGLRLGKKSFRPHEHFKKYRISKAQ